MDLKLEMRNRIAEYRERNDRMTQKDLGERIGVSQRAISYFENNKNIPNVLLAKRMAIVLGTDIGVLFIDVTWEREK